MPHRRVRMSNIQLRSIAGVSEQQAGGDLAIYATEMKMLLLQGSSCDGRRRHLRRHIAAGFQDIQMSTHCLWAHHLPQLVVLSLRLLFV